MKKIKVFIAISFLFVLSSCEDIKGIYENSNDNKTYFACDHNEWDDIWIQISIDTKNKNFHYGVYPGLNYEEDEVSIRADFLESREISGDPYMKTTYEFYKITGDLEIKYFSYESDKGRYKYSYSDKYKCTKKVSLI